MLKNKDYLPFEKKIYLSSPTMHGGELEYMKAAYDTNWMSTVGENIDAVERGISDLTGCGNAVALSSGTASLHLSLRLAGIELYGAPEAGRGALAGHRVFCTDMTFGATVNPVAYEGGIPVFIDTERDTWNMDPEALRKAFEIYPDVKIVVCAHLYGTPAKVAELTKIVRDNGAVLIEDAAESLGASYMGRQTGSFGKYNTVSFNGNKIITGSSGGCFLTDSASAAARVRKWSTQSREPAPWYQHDELGYNYRMSNVVAGVIRGQLPHLGEHIAQKKAIYERYRAGFADLPVSMNPTDTMRSEPNYWLSCILIDESAMCVQKRGALAADFEPEPGKSCPTEILGAISALNAEGRPIWKPMHMQPIYAGCAYVTAEGEAKKADGSAGPSRMDVGRDIFERGLCLPSDNKMTPDQQDRIIEIVRACFE